jgi:hypothetical protein
MPEFMKTPEWEKYEDDESPGWLKEGAPEWLKEAVKKYREHLDQARDFRKGKA